MINPLEADRKWFKGPVVHDLSKEVGGFSEAKLEELVGVFGRLKALELDNGESFLRMQVADELWIARFVLGAKLLEYLDEQDKLGTPVKMIVGVQTGGLTWTSWLEDVVRLWNFKKRKENKSEQVDLQILGVITYDEFGNKLEKPRIKDHPDLDLTDTHVLVVDDLVDTGDSMKSLTTHLKDDLNASKITAFVCFIKGNVSDQKNIDELFYFLEIPNNWWVIFSREAMHTMLRTFGWIEDGDSLEKGMERFRQLGYSEDEIKQFLWLAEQVIPG